MSAIDSRSFRDAMGLYASGITVVSGRVAGEDIGFTCQSFFSVSLDPLLVAICVAKTSTTWPVLRPTGAFVINVLAATQQHLSQDFAREVGAARWRQVDIKRDAGDLPVIGGALLTITCTLEAEHDAGDHLIVIGRVTALTPADAEALADPLLYYRGAYRTLASAVGE